MFAEVRRLQKEEGVGAAGCLPLLVQLPVFLGLYHLLARFADPGTGGSNGVFGPDQVRSFAHAQQPLAATVRSVTEAMVCLAPAGVLAGGLLVPVPLALILHWAVNAPGTKPRPC